MEEYDLLLFNLFSVKKIVQMKETIKRLIAGFSIGGVVIVLLNHLFFWYGIFALLIILFFNFLGLREYFNAAKRNTTEKPISFLGHFFGLLIIFFYYFEFLYISREFHQFFPFFLDFLEKFNSFKNPIIPLIVLLIILSKTYSMMFRPLEGNIYNTMSTVTGVLYISLPFALVLPMLALEEGIFIFTYVALGTIMTDVGGYFGGRWFGKHNAGLKVSPKKTYEGYIAGIIYANIFNLAYLYIWISLHPELNLKVIPGYIESIVITLIISLISIFGDLVESAIKRDAKIKDSSNIIPGHGGVLDLVDAMLFTLPLGYFYFYIKIHFF